jgi:hypothetical protein
MKKTRGQKSRATVPLMSQFAAKGHTRDSAVLHPAGGGGGGSLDALAA